MREKFKKLAEIIQIICGLIIVIIACADLPGRPARLVDIIGLIAGSFTAGIGAGILAERVRSRRKKNIT